MGNLVEYRRVMDIMNDYKQELLSIPGEAAYERSEMNTSEK